MTTDTIYRKLARHLDDLPGGFPATDSGVELRILRRLFSSAEARLALHLTLIPETARVIARRAGLPLETAEARLAAMAAKGLLLRHYTAPGPPRYMAAQYVIGIWEFHVHDLDPELIRDMNLYMPALFQEAWKVPQLRTIPVARSLDGRLEILAHEQAEALVRGAKTAAVAPCICRKERRLVGEGCAKPLEMCLSFGSAADYYRHNNLGRAIEIPEALDILQAAEEAGLVLQPGNAREAAFICCCCGCCCGVLRSLKRFPDPACRVSSPFAVTAAAEGCQACGACQRRCPMDALQVGAAGVVVNPLRCIGCGLCVPACTTRSLSLVRKPPSAQPEVPQSLRQNYLRLGRARGKLGLGTLAQLQVKSKIDRLLS